MFCNKKLICILIIFLAPVLLIFGQSRGAILDDQYDNLPRRAELSSISYEGLPDSFSLRHYAPLAGDQGDFGTCVGWAASYAARTISESIALNRLNQTESTQNAFSVVHIYKNIRPDDPQGLYGAQIYAALDFMRDTGTVRMPDIERELSLPRIDLANFKTLRLYPIADYVTLFTRQDRQKMTLITRVIKKSLTEGKPVIIGMNTPNSFLDAVGVWEPAENPQNFYGGHAMCVTGYDDNKYGGAFEVLNSWGRKWGNGGYIWIPYNTFADFVYEGYEIIDNISNFSDGIRFSGYVQMEIADQQAETVSFILTENRHYKSTQTLAEGSQVSFTIGSGESAYVYSFMVSHDADADNFFAPVLLFPQTGISPLLNYSDSAVTLPGENRLISMDTSGTKYLITLYSKQALDIHGILRIFASTRGTINKRLVASIGDSYTTSLLFSENEASFTAAPDDPRTVAALIISIESK